MDKRKKVLVIGHEASLSGAPVLLFNLFKLLIEQELVDVKFVVRRGGPLVELYKEIAPVIVLKPAKYGEEKAIVLHILHWMQNKINLCRVLIEAFSCDYFFFNTVINGRLLRFLRWYRKPVVTYVHEMGITIDFYLKKNDAVLPLSISDLVLYPSTLTKDLLLDKYNIPVHKLKRLDYYFSFKEDEFDPSAALAMRSSFRQKFGISNEEFLVGAVGIVSQRKGFDLFIEVCERTVEVNPAIKFVWIGAFENMERELEVRNIIKEKQLDTNLFFTGPLYYNVYNFSPFDIFFLSSREDTYPLVVLEAAIMKVPAICFSGSGGIVEFIGHEAGWIVNDFSTNDAAAKIVELESKKDLVSAYGNAAFNKVISTHCNPCNIVSQYNRIVEGLLK